MPGAQYYTFKELRPPVAVDGRGKSPLKTGLKLATRSKKIDDPLNQ